MKHSRPTQAEKIIDLMKDGEWHNATELHNICWRYGARIFELKREHGYIFERKRDKNKLYSWRLLNI